MIFLIVDFFKIVEVIVAIVGRNAMSRPCSAK